MKEKITEYLRITRNLLETKLQSVTIKLSSERKQHYSFIFKLLLKKSIQVTWLCSRADINSMYSPSVSITASIRTRNWEHTFSTSAGGCSANTRRMATIRLALVLWEVMLVMFSTYDQTKKSSGFRSGEKGASERRYKVVAFLKPSLGLFGLVSRHRVLLPHPESTTGHLMTMQKALHPRDDVDRLYVPRKEGGRGHASIQGCVDASIRRQEDCIEMIGGSWLQ